METHVKVVGILNIVFGILGLFAAGIVFLAVAGGGLISGDPTAIKVTSIVAVAVSSALVLFSIPEIIAGIGLLKMKPWGRILGLVVAILNLINIPIGTAFGVYVLWVLLNKDVEQLFLPAMNSDVVVEQESN